jgi:hypothetical protein
MEIPFMVNVRRKPRNNESIKKRKTNESIKNEKKSTIEHFLLPEPNSDYLFKTRFLVIKSDPENGSIHHTS